MTTKQRKAAKDATKYHENQKRNDGKPFVSHPAAVFSILRRCEAPDYVCIAGFLHDTIEDTTMTYTMIHKKYGAKIAALVEGVTHYKKTETKKEHIMRMYAYSHTDSNVFILKLADVLHNLETFDTLKEHKKEAFYREKVAFLGLCMNRFQKGFSRYSLPIYTKLFEEVGFELEKIRERYNYGYITSNV